MLGSDMYRMKNSKRWSFKKIISITASSDAPDGKTAQPVSVCVNDCIFCLPYARMVHFQITAKI